MDQLFTLHSSLDKEVFRHNWNLISEAAGNVNKNYSGFESRIKEVNTLLNHVHTRNEGLILLMILVRQCSSEVLTEHSERWIRLCSQMLSSYHSDRTKGLACRTLTCIFRGIHTLQDVHRSILSRHANSFVVTLMSAGSEWKTEAFQTLYEYCILFPGPCISQKSVIENAVVSCLDELSSASSLVVAAGKLWAVLPTAVGNQAMGQAQAQVRGSQIGRLIALCHACLDSVLDGIIEKEVEMSAVRCHKGQEHQLVAFLLPLLHQRALVLLQQMQMSIGEALHLYWGVLIEVLSIHLVSADSEMSVKTHSMAYENLGILMRQSRGCHTVKLSLIGCLVTDVTPKLQCVTLQTTGSGLSSLNLRKKKGKKRGYAVSQNTYEISRGFSSPFKAEDDTKIAQAALAFIDDLFTFATSTLNAKAVLMLQKCLVSVANSIVYGNRTTGIYSSGEARRMLYVALTAMAVHPSPFCPPNYCHVFSLLQSGLQDGDPQVSETCQKGLNILSFITSNPQVSFFAEAVQQIRMKENQSEDEGLGEDTCEIFPRAPTPIQKSSTILEMTEVMKELPSFLHQDVTSTQKTVEVIQLNDSSDDDAPICVSEVVTESHTSTAVADVHQSTVPNQSNYAKEFNQFCESFDGSNSKRFSDLPFASKANKKQKTDGPSLEEMLSDFVNADPD